MSTETLPKDAKVHPIYWRYAVTKSGQIYSLFTRWRNHASPSLRPAPKVLRQKIAKGGYKRVSIATDGKVLTKNVARLVLETFVGLCPSGHECAHLDGNPANNCVENLAWKTAFENSRDRFIHGTVLAGERNPNAKLNWAKVDEIRALTRAGVMTKELCVRFGISRGIMQAIRAGKRWRENSRHYGVKKEVA